jgi:hypothetical protein
LEVIIMNRKRPLWLASVAVLVAVVGLTYAGILNRDQPTEHCETIATVHYDSTDECACESTASDLSESDTLDASSEIVFAVGGLTCPAVEGIGCGHQLGPVLQRLDSIEGVAKASANHTGTMIRVTLTSPNKLEEVAEIVAKDLVAENFQPQRINGDEAQNALERQAWRGPERIRELSAIEFRQLALRAIDDFSKNENLTEEVTAKLRQSAEKRWDRLADEAEPRDSGKLPDQTDWRKRFRDFASAFFEDAQPILTDSQFSRLKSFADSVDARAPDANE